MRLVINLLAIFTLWNLANAQVSPKKASDAQIFSGSATSSNYVLNPSCYKSKLNIVDAGGIVTAGSTTPLGEQGWECGINATTSGQKVCFSTNLLATTSGKLKNGNCGAGLDYRGDASLYKAYVEINSVKTTTDLQMSNVAEATPLQELIFPCGDLSNAPQVCIEATDNAAAAFEVANVYTGKPRNLGTVQQANFFGGISYANASNCEWTKSGGTFSSPTGFSADTDCNAGTPLGNGTAPSTKIPAVVFPTMPAGEYLVVVKNSQFICSSASDCFLDIHDGTTSSGIYISNSSAAARHHTYQARFSYTAAQSNITIQIRAATGDASNLSVPVNASNEKFEILVYYFPSASSQVVTQDVAGWFIDAIISGGSPDLGVTTQASPVEITDAALTLTPKTGSAAAGILCSGTNAAATPSTAATTCSAGSESLGVNFNIPAVGNYEICADYTTYLQVDSGVLIAPIFSFDETATNAQTQLQAGGSFILAGASGPSGTNLHTYYPTHVCGTFNFPSTGIKALRMKYTQSISGTPDASLILADGTRNVTIKVRRLNANANAPLLVNSVISSSTGIERIGRVRFGGASSPGTNCTGSPCTIQSQSGSWVSSVTRGSTGNYTINFAAGTFSSAPECFASGQMNGANAMSVNAFFATASSVNIATRDSTSTLTDGEFSVFCVGPK